MGREIKVSPVYVVVQENKWKTEQNFLGGVKVDLTLDKFWLRNNPFFNININI